MKLSLSNVALRRIFTAGILLVAAAFVAFLAYIYAAFSNALIGDTRSDIAPDLLKGLQSKKFETAVSRFEARGQLPDVPADLKNPFDAPGS